MILLLDTNVLIDYLGRKEPFFSAAQIIMMASFFKDAKAFVAAQSISDAFYILNRFVDSQTLQSRILKSLEVFSLVELSPNEVKRALTLGWDDLEDCLIALAGEKAQADYLITRDTNGFSRSMVPALSPEVWLSQMLTERKLFYDEVEI